MPRLTIDDMIKESGILNLPNVVGYSKSIERRERRGKKVEEYCIQIHVSKKVPERELLKQTIIPKSLSDIHTDVKVVGHLRIPLPALKKVTNKSKTDRIRPLVAGISIGNASITAGTLGWFMEKTTSPNKGEPFLGSNAHVFAEEPKNKTSNEKRILQPGAADGGTEVVAEYYWHKQLHPLGGNSECEISNLTVKSLNTLSALLLRKSRFTTIVEEVNHIDFAVARSLIGCKLSFFNVELPSDKFGFYGYGFAGSETVGVTCRNPYITQEGYSPIGYDCINAEVGDMLHKTGRTSCYSKAPIIVKSAYENINYGLYIAPFDDVTLTEKFLSPGDSGSSIWKEKL